MQPTWRMTFPFYLKEEILNIGYVLVTLQVSQCIFGQNALGPHLSTGRKKASTSEM